MRGDLRKDFLQRVNEIIENTMKDYGLEIGVAIGPDKVTLRPVQKYSHQSLEEEYER